MTLFMPPIQRKKKVEDKYNPDTFRVISDDALSDHPKFRPQPYRASFEPRTPTPKILERNSYIDDSECHRRYITEPLQPLKNTRVLPQLLPDFRYHNPQSLACGFLDKNVRFLNEPICNVYTAPVQREERQWWPARANPGQLLKPPYAEETHYRIDYNWRESERPQGSGRHTANVDREPALGTGPVNFLREKDGSQRFYKEGLSYEHIYNSRSDPNYPIRGKRHGAFVWSRMDPKSQQKFIEYYSRLEEEERRAAQTGEDGPLSASDRGTVPIIRSTNHKRSSAPTSPKRKSSLASSIGGKYPSKDSTKLNGKTHVDVTPVESNPPPAAPPAATTNSDQTAPVEQTTAAAENISSVNGES